MNSFKSVSLFWAVFACFGPAASAQIVQDKPELCGNKNQAVPLPPGISATRGDSGIFSTLFLKAAGSQAPVAIQVTMDSVDEVCPLSGNRLLVFGESNPATSVAIVDQTTDAIDSLLAYDPVVSPNQHWLVYRDFYPPQSEVPFSDEYLLYDLTKDNSANAADLTPYTAGTKGRVIFPAVRDGTPFEHSGLRSDETHAFSSVTFFWSQDSQSVIFADRVQKTLSVVLVKLDGEVTHSFTHNVAPAEACEQGSGGDPYAASLVLSNAIVGVNTIELTFQSHDIGACKPVSFILVPGDFMAAQMERHVSPPRKERSVMKPRGK